MAAAEILFHRGKARCQDGFQAVALDAVDVSGCSEVQEFCTSVFRDDDIVRLDISVDDVFFMDRRDINSFFS